MEIVIQYFGAIIALFSLFVAIGFVTRRGVLVLVASAIMIIGFLPITSIAYGSQITSIVPEESCTTETGVELTHYDQRTGTTQSAVYGASFNFAGIHVNSGSQLIGDTVSNATFYLSKTGAPTGTVRAAVYDSTSGTPIQKFLFGTKNIATEISTTDGYIKFANLTHTYVLAAGDRIAVSYTGGDASNRLNHWALNSNIFDTSATESNFLDPPAAWTNGGASWDTRAIIGTVGDVETCVEGESYQYENLVIEIDPLLKVLITVFAVLVGFVGVGKFGLSL